MSAPDGYSPLEGVAVVGMAGRFPGAKNTDEFWRNLRDGVESISFFSDEELLDAGVDAALLRDANYVRAKGILQDIDQFDAGFFGITPKEADISDPQHRFFFECAWSALEDAGYDPETYPGSISVYAGMNLPTYFLTHILPNADLIEAMGYYPIVLNNMGEYLATRLSYKLNLKGPSLNIQTACSTSLVAVCEAFQALMSYQSDMALAGGVSISVPHKRGYLYQESGIQSPDGHCRAFDVKAQGTVSGEGVGVVVLKRLEDALADGDHIYAVIRGAAINNDGSLKVGYTAPSVTGQAEVIAMAQAIADVDAETISYIEAHGTGTQLGDPVEIAALTKVFRNSTDKKGFCAIGSVKTNIGHLDTAAGIAGLIKTILALQHRQIPPSLHFHEPNPKIDFVNSPFYVNTELADWTSGEMPRRAGISSFGIGGTNAHVVLEEAMPVEPSPTSRNWHLLSLSAKSSTALEQATRNLADFLNSHPDVNLADVAYTLQVGRRAFNQRRYLVCSDVGDAVQLLQGRQPGRLATAQQPSKAPKIAFLFPGQGAQYVHMARGLYQAEPTFRETVDFCAEHLRPELGLDLRHLLYPDEGQADVAAAELQQTRLAQPAIFVIEYALAKLWMEWGIQPHAMLGHSLGDYVAATIAGVFSLEDVLALVAARGRLMQGLPPGTMLAVPLPEAQIRPRLGPHLALAAVNTPEHCVVSGPTEAIEVFQQQLEQAGIVCRRLHTSHAFHSSMMDPILEPFAEIVRQVALKPAQIPFISSMTGTWIGEAEATDPSYWVSHLRQTVRFDLGVRELLSDPNMLMLEVGPGQTLTTLVRQNATSATEPVVLPSLRHPREQQADVAFLLNTLGKLWLAGGQFEWSRLYAHETRRRLSLPTYPFDRQRHWVQPPRQLSTQPASRLAKRSELAGWFYVPSWLRQTPPLLPTQHSGAEHKLAWLIFQDDSEVGTGMVARLRQSGHIVTTVIQGGQYSHRQADEYMIDPGSTQDYEMLLNAMGRLPDKIVHLWNTGSQEGQMPALEGEKSLLEKGYYSLLFLTQALAQKTDSHPVEIYTVSTNTAVVTGSEELEPEGAALLGLSRVIPQEHRNIKCRNIDIEPANLHQRQSGKLVDHLMAEAMSRTTAPVVAYRGAYRWVQTFEPASLDKVAVKPALLRDQGVYLITGGLGGVGLQLANYLAGAVKAKLILTGRSRLPPREQWMEWLQTHGDQDEVSRKVRGILALEETGAEVLAISADTGNEEQMRAAIEAALARFGQLNGVIHAAGLASFIPLMMTDCAKSQEIFYPKREGLSVLEKALRGIPLDFCLLTSSLSAFLGGVGFGAYAAANAYMDAFAQKQNQKHEIPWICINWDSWQLDRRSDVHGRGAQAHEAIAMTPQEGVETFARILSLQAGNQVLVSVNDLQARLERWVLDLPQEKGQTEKSTSETRQDRPNLRTDYVAPRTELEGVIAGIWHELLGIHQIGIHDSFFDLGGDSLLGIQVIVRLRERLGIELSLEDLFNAPAIAELAEILSTTMLAAQTLQNAPSTTLVEREEIEL